MKIYYILILCLFCIKLYSQKTVYGTVKDKNTGELLSNVVISTNSKNVVISNKYGFFSIKSTKNNLSIKFSLIGYKYIEIQSPQKDSEIIVYLTPVIENLNQVTVSTRMQKIKSLQTSFNQLSQEKIKSIPSVTGIPDVLKSFQLLPGVQTSSEGTTNLNIRGGSYDQNLVLLDEAPIYNPAHALGFFSTFNTEAIKSATIYKGNFPAQYGGRLSSVIDIVMKEGNNRRFQGDVTIGLTANQITLQGPLKKGKSSYLIGFRNSNVGLLLTTIGSLVSTGSELNKDYIRFNDFNLKINHQLNEKNKLYFSFYNSNDAYNFKILFLINNLLWNNTAASVRWNHIYNKKLFSNLTFYTTQYSSVNKNEFYTNRYIWESAINEFGIKKEFNHYINATHNFKYGASVHFRNFNPGIIKELDSNQHIITKTGFSNNNYNSELALYFSNEHTLNENSAFQYGIRTTWFADWGPHQTTKIAIPNKGIVDTNINNPFGKIRGSFFSFEPRFSYRYLINEFSSLKVALSLTQQNLHLISNSTSGLPYDYWITASNEIKPQTSIQYLLGYYTEILNKQLVFQVEAYYKTLFNILDFKDNSNLLLEKNIELNTLQGQGKSYGLEFLIEKNEGRINGWLSYTLADTKYKIENVNNNQWYSPRYDIRHNLSLVLFYNKSKQTQWSATFKYTSGGFISLPTSTFRFDGILLPNYESKNNFELPAYHRLDLSIKTHGKKYDKKRIKSEWVFTIYNVYSQQNIFSLIARKDQGNIYSTEFGDQRGLENITKIYNLYLFGTIPTVALNIHF